MEPKKQTNPELAAEQAADTAMEQEQAAKQETDVGSYTHLFSTPFSYEGKTYETLTFRWDTLTGRDSLAIKNELLTHGKTLVLPAYTGEYLVGMAVRACTERDAKGNRVVDTKLIQSLPLTDFQTICGRARTFLLRAGR